MTILKIFYMEKLIIAGREFNSRLFLGTGKFPNNQLMKEAIAASETEMVTVAMKRVDLNDKEDDLLNHILNPPAGRESPLRGRSISRRRQTSPVRGIRTVL